jgi:hypothetical protein
MASETDIRLVAMEIVGITVSVSAYSACAYLVCLLGV